MLQKWQINKKKPVMNEIDDYFNTHYFFNEETKKWEYKVPLVEGGLTGEIKFSNKVEKSDIKPSTPKVSKVTKKKRRRRKKKA